MKATDFIVEFLIEKGVGHIFGYPGGMVTHLIDSLYKYKGKIGVHNTCHEQAAALAACGYAQAGNRVGVAYATSGPGATNLLTGICNAYFDSIPVLFITGQVNTFELKQNLQVRQRGFQETDIVSMTREVTKLSVQIQNASDIKYYLEYAFFLIQEGRRGPVLLDIPMNIMGASIDISASRGYSITKNDNISQREYQSIVKEYIEQARRPVILIGNGLQNHKTISQVKIFVEQLKIPVVSSMLAIDRIPEEKIRFGFLGTYGNRIANIIVAKCDLLLVLGSRLDIRQVGKDRNEFAKKAKIIRIDIDRFELDYNVHNNDVVIHSDLNDIASIFDASFIQGDFSQWYKICLEIREKLEEIDNNKPNFIVKELSKYVPENAIITTDVGQNQVWVAHSFVLKPGQQVLFSGGHGAMGYSLPAAIGSFYATNNTVFSFNGDGGVQMNIQELETIKREKLPIKIIILNNKSLGMIRFFQEQYFNKNYFQTTEQQGYSSPNFERIAAAYEMPYTKILSGENIDSDIFKKHGPEIIEVIFQDNTYVFPKLEYGRPVHDQYPLLDRKLFNHIMEI